MMILGVMDVDNKNRHQGKQNGAGSGISGAMMEVGRSAESTFYSFLELISDVLGFTVTTDTTRDKVGGYFKALASGIEKSIQELVEFGNKIEQSRKEGKELELKIKIGEAKNTLIALKGYIESLKDIGDANKVVDVQASQSGVTANQAKLEASI